MLRTLLVSFCNILIQNIICFIVFFYIYLYDCIAFIGYSKHELDAINMLGTSRKNGVILHPYLPIKATFFCPQGGRCGEV